MKHIVMLSYGKDSTVMLDIMLRRGDNIDHVIFCDTTFEFQELMEYKDRYNEYLKSRYGIDVVTLTPSTTFESWIFGKIKRGKRIGQIRGIPMQTIPCYWKSEAKQKPAELWVKERYPKEQVTFYVGFAKGEDRSIQDTEHFTYKYPLEELCMTEVDCLVYLREHEMENPLYTKFARLGCTICPYQQEKTWKIIHDDYPDQWEWVKKIEKKLQSLEDSGETIANKFFFMGHLTTHDMENKFKMVSDGLFDLSDEPLRDCFCRR